jgi:6-phosphogluconate dehydrogenase
LTARFSRPRTHVESGNFTNYDMSDKKSDFGLIGLAVMGQNLVLNVESRGFQVSVYNRTTSVTDEFVAKHPGKKLVGTKTLEEFVQSLARPRKIHIMVKSTAVKDSERDAVDAVIEQLIPLLEKDDIIIDGGNSFYQTTERRDAYLSSKGLRFIGAGVSGGEEGARKGPSIMPGGPPSTWEVMKPIFESIAAKVDGEPCVIHIGPGGAGHYVKMIHNGIEYGDMQLICEAYNIFKNAGFTTEEMAKIFNEWNEGDLLSYLIQITGKALEQKDAETGKPIVELIVDKAGQKGTGQWTLMNAAENAIVISTINAAVEARILSSQKKQRVAASKELTGPKVNITTAKADLVKKVHDALYASKIISYAQGLDLVKTMGEKKNWGLDLGRIAAIWRGGCIIRAKLLEDIRQAFAAEPELENILVSDAFVPVLRKNQAMLKAFVHFAASSDIPCMSAAASLNYLKAYSTERLPANLIQAQRDYFGAHTYQRIDEDGIFHTPDWDGLTRNE